MIFAAAGVLVSDCAHIHLSCLSTLRVQAAAHGVPIVATANGGPVDIVRTLRNGCLVEPTDVRAISDALVQIVTDTAVWERYSASGRDRIIAYTWPAHCLRYVRAIEEEKRRHRVRIRAIRSAMRLSLDDLSMADVQQQLQQQLATAAVAPLSHAASDAATAVPTGTAAETPSAAAVTQHTTAATDGSVGVNTTAAAGSVGSLPLQDGDSSSAATAAAASPFINHHHLGSTAGTATTAVTSGPLLLQPQLQPVDDLALTHLSRAATLSLTAQGGWTSGCGCPRSVYRCCSRSRLVVVAADDLDTMRRLAPLLVKYAPSAQGTGSVRSVSLASLASSTAADAAPVTSGKGNVAAAVGEQSGHGLSQPADGDSGGSGGEGSMPRLAAAAAADDDAGHGPGRVTLPSGPDVGIALCTTHCYKDACSMLEAAGVMPQDLDFLVCDAGAQIWHTAQQQQQTQNQQPGYMLSPANQSGGNGGGASCATSTAAALLDGGADGEAEAAMAAAAAAANSAGLIFDQEWEAHYDRFWDSAIMRQVLKRLVASRAFLAKATSGESSAAAGNGGASGVSIQLSPESGPFHFMINVRGLRVDSADAAQLVARFRSLLRRNGLRAQLLLAADFKPADAHSMTLHVTPLRASRSLSIRFLAHRHKLPLEAFTLVVPAAAADIISTAAAAPGGSAASASKAASTTYKSQPAASGASSAAGTAAGGNGGGPAAAAGNGTAAISGVVSLASSDGPELLGGLQRVVIVTPPPGASPPACKFRQDVGVYGPASRVVLAADPWQR